MAMGKRASMAKAGEDGLVAVLLAGGRGTRLGALTQAEAKPAIPFLGDIRIVDFVMDNAHRSSINTMLVCTQWCPDTLVSHLRSHWQSGFPGGLFFRDGLSLSGPGGYRGTAHAVACNANELDAANTRQLLVLAGDHIYDMNYQEMLAAHRREGLPVTVATLPVPLDEARGFGVFQTDGPCRARHFVEKPLHPPAMYGRPDRALASMGIYVFDWDWLRPILSHPGMDDFGMDILPGAVDRGEVGVWCFARGDEPGYWRDVGTPAALDAARADLKRPDRPIGLPRFPLPSGLPPETH
jgi:glucose-1-phosphate adenylyltransferase